MGEIFTQLALGPETQGKRTFDEVWAERCVHLGISTKVRVNTYFCLYPLSEGQSLPYYADQQRRIPPEWAVAINEGQFLSQEELDALVEAREVWLFPSARNAPPAETTR